MDLTTRSVQRFGRAGLTAAAIFGLLLTGCDDKTSAPTDTPDTNDTPDVTDTTPGDTAPPADTEPEDTAPPLDTTPPVDTSPEDTAGKTTWSQVHSIFVSACAPCHSGFEPTGGAGNHAIASANADTAYQASQLDAGIAKCAGKKVGECALIRIIDGSMPQGKNCGSNPNGAGCVSAANQALIQQWIQDGMLR